MARTSGQVVGRLANIFGPVLRISREFEIGEGTNYLPVSISSASVSTAATSRFYMTAETNWNLGGSGSNYRSDEERQLLLDPDQGGNPGIFELQRDFQLPLDGQRRYHRGRGLHCPALSSGTWNNTTLTTPILHHSDLDSRANLAMAPSAIGRSTVAAFRTRERVPFTAASCLTEKCITTCACVDFARSCLEDSRPTRRIVIYLKAPYLTGVLTCHPPKLKRPPTS